MVRRFFVSGFARTKSAVLFSGFAGTVTGDNGTVVPLAVTTRGSNSGGAPIAATKTARKDDSTIATGNGSTGGGAAA